MDSNFQKKDDKNKVENVKNISESYYISNNDSKIFFDLMKNDIFNYEILLKYYTNESILNNEKIFRNNNRSIDIPN